MATRMKGVLSALWLNIVTFTCALTSNLVFKDIERANKRILVHLPELSLSSGCNLALQPSLQQKGSFHHDISKFIL